MNLLRLIYLSVIAIGTCITMTADDGKSGIVFLDNSHIETVADILSPYKGTPVLVDLWSTQCKPCIASFAHVKPIQEYAAANGIVCCI